MLHLVPVFQFAWKHWFVLGRGVWNEARHRSLPDSRCMCVWPALSSCFLSSSLQAAGRLPSHMPSVPQEWWMPWAGPAERGSSLPVAAAGLPGQKIYLGTGCGVAVGTTLTMATALPRSLWMPASAREYTRKDRTRVRGSWWTSTTMRPGEE